MIQVKSLATNLQKINIITHNHSDHVADLGTLLLRSWQSGHKGMFMDPI